MLLDSVEFCRIKTYADVTEFSEHSVLHTNKIRYNFTQTKVRLLNIFNVLKVMYERQHFTQYEILCVFD